MSDKLERLIGFWKFEAKSGKKGLSTKSRIDMNIPAGSKLMVMANEYKRNPQDPDYFLFMAKEEEKKTLTPVAQEEELPF